MRAASLSDRGAWCPGRRPGQLTYPACSLVRSEAAAVQACLATGAGRGLAPSLKQLCGPWWAAQHDEHAETARRSSSAFQACFPGRKAREALQFCQPQARRLHMAWR